MMNQDSLRNWFHYNRKLVSTIAILLFILLVALRMAIIPVLSGQKVDLMEAVNQLLDGLIIAISISGIVTLFLWWISPVNSKNPEWGEIAPKKISQAVRSSARSAYEWAYVGHTSRFTRVEIFPILAQTSKQERRSIRVRLVILNPNNSQLAKKYSNYRIKSRTGEQAKNKWSDQKVIAELLATTIAVAELNNGNHNVRCELHYRDFVSQLRFDLSPERVIVTQEDQQEAAFSYSAESDFYRQYRNECDLVFEQTVAVKLTELEKSFAQGRAETIATLCSMFSEINNIEGLSGEAYDAFEQRKSPYA